MACFQSIVREEIIGSLSASMNSKSCASSKSWKSLNRIETSKCWILSAYSLKKRELWIVKNPDIFLMPRKIRYINNKKSSYFRQGKIGSKMMGVFGLRAKLILEDQTLKKSSFIIRHI